LGAVLALSLPLAGSASSSPAKLMASILAAGKAQQSVHYVALSRYHGAVLSQVADVGKAEGIQRNVFRYHHRLGKVTIIVHANNVYFRGNAFALSTDMGFEPDASREWAGTWILVPKSDPHYAIEAAAVTLTSILDECNLRYSLEMAVPTTVAGQSVIGVKGKASRSAPLETLYARASGSPLPVRESYRQGENMFRIDFSKWNEPVLVTVPRGAAPIYQTGLE
jgi:hypothetical protein